MSVADRLAIHDLFVRYATALDDGEVETVVDCFTADAALESPVIGRIEGADAIRAFAARFAAQRAAGTQFRHLITNLAAEIAPAGDRARATAYLLVMISQDGRALRRCRPAATNANWSNRVVPGASPAASSLTTTPIRSMASETGRGAALDSRREHPL